MTKKYLRYFYMFTIAVISLGLFNAGCTTQPKRISALEEQFDVLSHSIKGLDPEINELREKLDTQKSGIDARLNTQSNTSNRLNQELSATGDLLQEIKKNLALIQEDKAKMKIQIEELESQLKKLETLSKSTGADTDIIQGLLGNAVELYRQGKFEEASLKWKEVLARDPGRLDAEFNIEIAKDRIKEKEIHEELKALLIQRK